MTLPQALDGGLMRALGGSASLTAWRTTASAQTPAAAPRVRLVVAKYRDDVSWLRALDPRFEVIVYNKDTDRGAVGAGTGGGTAAAIAARAGRRYDSAVPVDAATRPLRDATGAVILVGSAFAPGGGAGGNSGAAPHPAQEVDLLNIGREAHTYFLHLARHYDALRDVEVFCQGNPSHEMNGAHAAHLNALLRDAVRGSSGGGGALEYRIWPDPRKGFPAFVYRRSSKRKGAWPSIRPWPSLGAVTLRERVFRGSHTPHELYAHVTQRDSAWFFDAPLLGPHQAVFAVSRRTARAWGRGVYARALATFERSADKQKDGEGAPGVEYWMLPWLYEMLYGALFDPRYQARAGLPGTT